MARYSHDEVVPYHQSAEGKKQQISAMFDRIAFRYDLLNRLLSCGIDGYWRRKAINQLSADRPQYLLDVATGTADMAILCWRLLKPRKIVGIDISSKMLEIGNRKIAKLLLNNKIELKVGDSEAINFPNDTFDAVTVAFGVRNFENLEKGLAEINRVVKSGGRVVVLEFSYPKVSLFKAVYSMYMRIVAPRLAGLLSKNREAYQYLNNSVKAFPQGESFLHILQQVGFTETSQKRLSLGICTIYCGRKKLD